jgi:polar amino acid transport system permease protein
MDMEWYIVWDYRAAILDGLLLTLQLSVIAIIGSTIIGTVVGCLSTMPSVFLRKFTGVYVETLRNMPVVVKLFFMHFIIGLDSFPSGVIALVLHQSSYISDVTAAGLRSVPYGQTEAARSCGHSYSQLFGYILVPQAIRFVIPPMTTQYVQTVKNSSVVMLIALEELTFMTQKIEHETFRGFEAASAVTVIYLVVVLVIAVAMTMLQKYLERKHPA